MILMVTELGIKRENEILRILKLFKGLNLIVVGGYAVDAYTVHRFSVDLDIVIKKEDLRKFEKTLVKEGYSLETSKKGFDTTYSGEFRRYMKDVGGKVDMDLLIESLVSRTTNASWSFDFLKKNSSKRLIKGFTENVEAFVLSKEMLIAAKLHSGRVTDLRDITMLNIDLEQEKILSLLSRGDMRIVANIINRFIEHLNDKNFIDSLKGVFSISGLVRKPDLAEIQIKKTLRLLEFLKNKIIK